MVNTISVDVDSLSLGKHTVKVVVSDGQGGTATRTWTFTRTNSAPTISGSDGNLGDKNLGFTYAYTIDDADGDTLTVVEELNDETIRTINNAPKGEELTVTITSEKLYALGLNSVNTSRSPSRTARAARPTAVSPSEHELRADDLRAGQGPRSEERELQRRTTP